MSASSSSANMEDMEELYVCFYSAGACIIKDHQGLYLDLSEWLLLDKYKDVIKQALEMNEETEFGLIPRLMYTKITDGLCCLHIIPTVFNNRQWYEAFDPFALPSELAQADRFDQGIVITSEEWNALLTHKCVFNFDCNCGECTLNMGEYLSLDVYD